MSAMSSVLGKFYKKAEPRTIGLQVTGWDLKADPPAVLGREMYAGPDSPEIRVSLNNQPYAQRKPLDELAKKARVGGIMRFDKAIPDGVNSYSANWAIVISNSPGHGLLLRGQARLVLADRTDVTRGFKVDVLADAPAVRVTTRDELEKAVKDMLREGHRGALAGTTPIVFLRVMDSANPAAAADLFSIHLRQEPNETLDDAIAKSLANSKSLQAFVKATDRAVTYPDALLIEVARATQFQVGKDSAQKIAKNLSRERYLQSETVETKAGGSDVRWRSAGFTESLVGIRHMPERTEPGLESPERYIAMNVAAVVTYPKFSPSGRVEHAQAEQHAVVQEHGDAAEDELPDDFALEDLPSSDDGAPSP